MTINGQIVLLARETGWSLEYIRALSWSHFSILIYEISYQRQVENYHRAYHAAMIICTLASSKSHHYRPEELVGHVPERRVMDMKNLGDTVQINKITLADGKEYELATLTVNMMIELEEQFSKPFDELVKSLSMKMLRALVFYRLRAKNPGLTEEQVGNLVTVEVLANVRKGLVS